MLYMNCQNLVCLHVHGCLLSVKYVLYVLTLPMSALCGTVGWFAGPVGCVGFDVEGVTGGGLQVPDNLLQRNLADGLLIFHFHRV